jgi:hypothetical protein
MRVICCGQRGIVSSVVSVGDERGAEAKARCATACRVHANLCLRSHDEQIVYFLRGEVRH